MSQIYINNVERQNVNNNSVGQRVLGSAAVAAGATLIAGTSYMVGGVYTSPKIKNENFVRHMLRDMGTDIKKRYTSFFNRISCPKIADKVKNMKELSLAGIWLGVVFKLFMLLVYLLSLKKGHEPSGSDNM